MTGSEQVLIEDWCQQYPSHSVGLARVRRGRRALRLRRRRRELQLHRLRPGRQSRSTRAAIRPAVPGRRSRRRPRRAARCAPRTSGRRGDPVTWTAPSSASTPRPARAARQPALHEPRPERAPDHRKRLAQPVPHHRSPRHERGLDRRRRLERPGRRSTASRPADRRDRRQLRLALLRGRRPAGQLRRRQPDHLREPLRGRAARGHLAATSRTTTPTRSSRASRARPGSSSISPASPSTTAGTTPRPTRARSSSPTTRAAASGSCARARTAFRIRTSVTTFARGAPGRWTSRSAPAATCSTLTSTTAPIRRIRYLGSNQPPTAVALATPTSGPTPLTVNFDGTPVLRPRGRHPHVRLGPRRRRRVRRLDARRSRASRTRRPRTYTVGAPGDRPPGRPGDRRRGRDRAATTPRPSRRSPRRPPRRALEGRRQDLPSPARPPTRRTGRCRRRALSWRWVMQHCPSQLPHPPDPGLRRRRGRHVRGARPRVPVVPRAASSRRPTPKARATTVSRRLDPQTVDLTSRRSRPACSSPSAARRRDGAVHPHRDRRLDQHDRRSHAAGGWAANYDFASWSDGGAAVAQDRRAGNAGDVHGHVHETGRAARSWLLGFDEARRPTAGRQHGPAATTARSPGAHLDAGRADSAARSASTAWTTWVTVPDADAPRPDERDDARGVGAPGRAAAAWRTVLLQGADGDSLAYALYANDRRAAGPDVDGDHRAAVRRARERTGRLPLEHVDPPRVDLRRHHAAALRRTARRWRRSR